MENLLKAQVLFSSGHTMKNPFFLAPLTNRQSNEDGTLSQEEFKWLTMRAKGQFGMVMTCASHVQKNGKGFPGQLGIFSDQHIEGHKKLTKEIRSYGSLALIQLHHAGMRSPHDLIDGKPVCPSDNEEFDARELRIEEVKELKNAFINAAVRSKQCGYDGIEIHGAHGYVLTQFLSSTINNRTDNYGGSLENRSRILFEIIDGIRQKCGVDFLVGVRLSPERYGQKLKEIKLICERIIKEDKVDFLDISLWDVGKHPEEEEYKHKPLLSYFTDMDWRNTRLTVAGKISNGSDVINVLNAGVDFVGIGKSAILHHDFPIKVMENASFKAVRTPVNSSYLREEGLSDVFIDYMRKWDGFVK